MKCEAGRATSPTTICEFTSAWARRRRLVGWTCAGRAGWWRSSGTLRRTRFTPCEKEAARRRRRSEGQERARAVEKLWKDQCYPLHPRCDRKSAEAIECKGVVERPLRQRV